MRDANGRVEAILTRTAVEVLDTQTDSTRPEHLQQWRRLRLGCAGAERLAPPLVVASDRGELEREIGDLELRLNAVEQSLATAQEGGNTALADRLAGVRKTLQARLRLLVYLVQP